MKMTSLILLLIGLSLSSCQNSQTKESANMPEDAKLRARMHELSQVVATLIPLSFSYQEFHKPENQKTIDKAMTQLKDLAHTIEAQPKGTELDDSSLRLIAQEFESEIDLAMDAFEGGQKEFSRFVLRDTLSYCIECHTHRPQGAHFMVLDFGPQVENLNLISRGEFYAATRQFDRALAVFTEALRSQDLNPMEWEKTSLHALTITIRYLRSPEQALEITDLILSRPDLPFYMKRDASNWRKALVEWQREWAAEQKLKDGDLLKKANQLIGRAKQRGEHPTDAASAIENLRASALLHMYISEKRTATEEAGALYLLGQAYHGVRQFNLSSLEDRFYESCIRKAPHTEVAQSCYRRFRENTLLGYSGSAGLMLPADVQMKLSELQSLAAPKVK